MNQLFEQFLVKHKTHRVQIHIFFWICIYGLGIVASQADSNLSISQNIVLHIQLMVAKIPIAYWVVYKIIPMFFDQKKYLQATILFLLVYYFNFCLTTLFKILVYPRFDMYVINEIDQFYPSTFFESHLFSNLGATTTMVLIKLLLNRTEFQRKSLLLSKQKSELELRLLKSQLNPHFLFNTLNNIYSLSLSNSPQTSDSIARLSDILDHILYKCEASKVPLSSEIELLENFLKLEKLRYTEDLNLKFDYRIEGKREIAPLIMLSLVENAFKHGASKVLAKPYIHINLHQDKHLAFTVKNSIEVGSSPKSNQGIGLKNIRSQLDLIYGEKYSLQMLFIEDRCELTFKIFDI